MNETQLNEQTDTNKSPLMDLISALKPIQHLLAQNTYIKDTSKKLARIIEDAESNTIVLVMGNEGVGKTSIINSILGTIVLPTTKKYPSPINIFLKYGEENVIKAHFSDGMIATFDMTKLDIFTTSDAFIAEIIREHLEYIEVFVANPLLQQITIIDSVALEKTPSESAYLSELLLQRADEVVWVVRANQGLTTPEMLLLNKYVDRGIAPHLIINAIDELQANRFEVIQEQKNQLEPFVASITAVSAKQALEAKKTNNAQLQIDSQIAELNQLFNHISKLDGHKLKNTINRLSQWLDNFYVELKYLLLREPLLSAKLSLQGFNGAEDFEYSRQQRDLAIVRAYKEEYASVANVFQPVQTLYQLLQLLTKEIYLRDEAIETFEEVASMYQSYVREYRKLHVEYMQSYGVIDSQLRKKIGKSIDQINLEEHSTPEVIAMLDKYNKLVSMKVRIDREQQKVVELLPSVVAHLNELAKQRLEIIIAKTEEVNVYRQVEVRDLHSYNKKVQEFECVEEGQKMLVETLQPILFNAATYVDEAKKEELTLIFEKIAQVKLGIGDLQMDIPDEAEVTEEKIQINFTDEISFIPLQLEDNDVVSNIPEIPVKLTKK